MNGPREEFSGNHIPEAFQLCRDPVLFKKLDATLLVEQWPRPHAVHKVIIFNLAIDIEASLLKN